jgi:hypothetical protein
MKTYLYRNIKNLKKSHLVIRFMKVILKKKHNLELTQSKQLIICTYKSLILVIIKKLKQNKMLMCLLKVKFYNVLFIFEINYTITIKVSI